MSLSTIQRKLGYTFGEVELLNAALTHRSCGNINNERLEFLGDACLGFIVTDYLFRTYHDIAEGALTRLRSSLVNRRKMAALARKLSLENDLILGVSERNNHLAQQENLLSNATEAILGAIYLDGGIEVCREVVLRLLIEDIDAIAANPTLYASNKDSKTHLQEILQLHGYALPVYRVIDEQGAAHKRVFTVSCYVEKLGLTTEDTAPSKKQAEHKAADKLIMQIKQHFSDLI